jgi:aldehyde dehydrogenase (NAD+)
MRSYQNFVGGKWCDPVSDEWFESFDPYAGQPWALIPRCNSADAERAVEAARNAFTSGDWPKLAPTQRGALLRKLGDIVAERVEELAEIEVRDNGKRLVEVLPQFRYLPRYYHYYAGLADKVEGSVIPLDVPEMFNYTRYEPLGVVVAITPWNSPLMIAAWKLAPALAAGNTVVLKPSEHASASTLEFARLIESAELPPGVVNVITGIGSEVGEALVTHPMVRKITFTGSDVAGQRIATLAAADIKLVTLELGGKSPQIVFEDAKLENAVHGVISGIFVSLGQSCVAGSRLLLQDSIHDRFLERLLAIMRNVCMGNPLDSNTQIGPIATKAQYEKVLDFIASAEREGATCVLGGKPAAGADCRTGWFVEPTVFTGVRNDMRLARDEVFGPILAVMRFTEEQEAVRIANDTRFGLAAGVWTEDMRRATRIAEQLEAGTIYVNTYRHVSALSPVGGYKRSGYGRENGVDTIKEFMQQKSVWVGLSNEIPNPFPSS